MQSSQEESPQGTSPVLGRLMQSSTPESSPILGQHLQPKPLLPHDLLQVPRYPKMYRELEVSTKERMDRLIGELRTCFDERSEIRSRTLRAYDSRVNSW